MKQLLCELLCWAIGHNQGVTIRYGWAITTCQRCQRFASAERLQEPAP